MQINPSSPKCVMVTAPSRLHFGLFAFGTGYSRKFGGVGMMVDNPCLRLEVRESERFQCDGLHAARLQAIANQCCGAWMNGQLPNCSIVVHEAPREHIGLGLGTQLSLAVATAIRRFALESSSCSIEQLSAATGRAARSSVGTHGFEHGGFLVDVGKRKDESVGQLLARASVCPAWRVVLITPRSEHGLSGMAESNAFSNIPDLPKGIFRELFDNVLSDMLPAAQSSDFQRFSESVYQYGKLAGSCFAAVQHGAYASPQVAQLVNQLRGWGITGVGQTSWGPTVFAFTRNQAEAKVLQERIEADNQAPRDIVITPPNNAGANVSVGRGNG